MRSILKHGSRFAALLLLFPALAFIVPGSVVEHRPGTGTGADLLPIKAPPFDRVPVRLVVPGPVPPKRLPDWLSFTLAVGNDSAPLPSNYTGTIKGFGSGGTGRKAQIANHRRSWPVPCLWPIGSKSGWGVSDITTPSLTGRLRMAACSGGCLIAATVRLQIPSLRPDWYK